MAYVKETCIAGDTIEVRKYYTTRFCRKGQQRGPVIGQTSEKARQVNERNSRMNLTRIINTNFRAGDLHMVMTYRKDQRPAPEIARKEVEKFLRKLRAEYRRHSQELKYIQVTEYEDAAIHHHLLINNIGINIAEISALWPHGQVRPTVLDNRVNHAALANYFVKETSRHLKRKSERDIEAQEKEKDFYVGKRWSSSRNLKKPIIYKEIIEAEKWSTRPTPKKGYIIEADSIEEGVSEETGYPYQFYRMIAVKPQKRAEFYGEAKDDRAAGTVGGKRADHVVPLG